MSSFTENLYLKRQIQELQNHNNKLKRLINEASEQPYASGAESLDGSAQTGGYSYPGTKQYGLTNATSPIGYGRTNGNRNPGTGGPLYVPGYLPPNIMYFIIRFLGGMGGDPYGLIQNGQFNWLNYFLQIESNPEFNSYIVPLFSAIYNQLGEDALTQFAVALRQAQASLDRR